jgi:protease I
VPRPICSAREAGEIQAFNHLDKGDRFPVDVVVSDADPTTMTRRPAREALPILMLCEPTATRWSSSRRSSLPASRSV